MSDRQDPTPILRMLNGPTPGRLFLLDRKTTLIGRLPDNHIVLQPKYISKRHATIERTPEGYMLIDHSHAGTCVAGEKIDRPVLLKDGMIVQICNFAFSFHMKLVTIQERDDTATIFHSLDASTSLSRPSTVEPREKLRLVLAISRDLARTLDLGDILDGTLGTLFQVFPATHRGFVLLRERPDGALVPRAIRSRTPQSDPALAISRTILDRVLQDGQALLIRDALVEFSTSDSITDQNLRSLICAPLLDAQQQPIGVIQLDTADGTGRYNQDDLDLLAAVASQVSIAVEHARLHETVLKQRELEQELLFARQVLQALLPEPRDELGGFDFWAGYEPARQVGGDYYGYFPLSEPDAAAPNTSRRWAVAVGDVAGKGMPAALLMAKLSAEVRVVLQAESEPAAAVGRLNRLLYETGVLDLFVTFLLVVMDSAENHLIIVNAGHPPPLLRRHSGVVEEIRPQKISLPLGVEAREEFQAIDTRLGPGDLLVLYTDGVVDAANRGGREFGRVRLRQFLDTADGRASVVGPAILQAIHRHVAGRSPVDDITLLCLGRAPESLP